MSTKSFNEVIADYLKQRATEDTLFAPKFTNPKKSVDECCRYILGEARKQGTQVVMTDEKVFGLAVHYYDEENIKINASGGHRVSNTRQVDMPKKEPGRLSMSYNQPPVKRMKAKKEENKLQLSLFD